MPVKLSFADRDSRINFERSVREQTGLRVVQSLPKCIRDEMAAFRKALEARYPDQIIMTRPNTRNLEILAMRKRDGDKKWTHCGEIHPIPSGIMLPGFRTSVVTLPDMVPVERMEEASGDGQQGD
jgi:hypothetical protein